MKINSFFNLEYFYQSTLELIKLHGIESKDRTGVGTKRLENGSQLIIDISKDSIPLLRGKFVNPVNAFTEVMWILMGRTDNEFLLVNDVKYWNPWVDENKFGPGGLGKIYGHQMRNQNGFDQLLYVINKLRESPESRQAMITLWNGSDLKEQALPCCHFNYHPLIIDGKLNLHVTQRSADYFLGVPYDLMLFYYIGIILSFFTETKLNKIICTFNDTHIYNNQIESINKYLNNYNYDEKEIITKHIDKTFKSIDFVFPEYGKNNLTSESLTKWCEEFYHINKEILIKWKEENYVIGKDCYPLIKTPVAV